MPVVTIKRISNVSMEIVLAFNSLGDRLIIESAKAVSSEELKTCLIVQLLKNIKTSYRTGGVQKAQ